jgi:hypothetical protein
MSAYMYSDVREALVIRKALEENVRPCKGMLECQVQLQSVMQLRSLGCSGLCMTCILSDVVQQPADGLLVVVVVLTFNDELRWSSQKKI